MAEAILSVSLTIALKYLHDVEDNGSLHCYLQ